MKHLPTIRLATAADAREIGAIAWAAYSKYIPTIGRKPAPMVADYAAHIARGVAHVIAAEGRVRGCMIGWPEADAYFVDNLAIDPAAQGQGLGRKLIDHAAHQARRFGLRAVRLYTNVAMTESLAMYRHIGFAEMHRAMENGFDRVYMRWGLSRDFIGPGK